MDYFDRFEWAVPWAFHDAVDQCRFERGDTLYDTRDAYGPDWGEACKAIRNHLRVRYPDKLTTSSPIDGDSIFNSNWKSEVRVDVFEDGNQIESELVSTQGRLYTVVWHGDLSVLSPDTPDPDVPAGWRDVLARLESVEDFAEGSRFSGPVFAMPYDAASSLSREKYRAVLSRLDEHLGEGPVVLWPGEAGLDDADSVAPTVYVAFFPGRALSIDALKALVKDALYSPTKGARNPKFRLLAHGAIFGR
ncbi:MAG: hypothetical protein RQ745_10225 [Longimicrobiales bacterium]|nr:hypothetical protein [Longimicrobiales bacterium]